MPRTGHVPSYKNLTLYQLRSLCETARLGVRQPFTPIAIRLFR
jgi:hypothetical protein